MSPLVALLVAAAVWVPLSMWRAERRRDRIVAILQLAGSKGMPAWPLSRLTGRGGGIYTDLMRLEREGRVRRYWREVGPDARRVFYAATEPYPSWLVTS